MSRPEGPFWRGTRAQAAEHTARELERLLESVGASPEQQEAARASLRVFGNALPKDLVLSFSAAEVAGKVVPDPLRVLGFVATTLGQGDVIARENVPPLGWLSTIFLGSMVGPGQFYETVLFSGTAEGEHQEPDEHLLDWRWATRAEAEDGHRMVAARIAAGQTLEDLQRSARSIR